MLATLDDFDRVPRILRLNVGGQPVDWVSWQDAVCLYVRRLVVWTHGKSILRIRGGHSRRDGSQTSLEVHSIIACNGRVVAVDRSGPPMTNKALCARDHNLCLYCGGSFPDSKLTRDHVSFICGVSIRLDLPCDVQIGSRNPNSNVERTARNSSAWVAVAVLHGFRFGIARVPYTTTKTSTGQEHAEFLQIHCWSHH